MHHILAADIGGTHCRFAHFILQDDTLSLNRVTWLATADIPHTDALLEHCAVSLSLSLRQADVLVIALAGPVLDPTHGTLSNAPLRVDLRFAPARYGLRRCAVINDFTAAAYACLTEVAGRARRVVAPVSPAVDGGSRTLGVIGAGTGLGAASLLRDASGRWLAAPSEIGHCSFPFVGDRERAFHTCIRQELHLPYARGDDVLSGRGLSLLHRFLTGVKLAPKEISEVALRHESETLVWFSRFYGRACRNWILSTLCRGGLYIAGGIAAHNPLLLTSPHFERELRSSPSYAELLGSVPVFLMEDTNSGLWGAAQAGRMMLEQE